MTANKLETTVADTPRSPRADLFKEKAIGLFGAVILKVLGWTWRLLVKEESQVVRLPKDFWNHGMPVIFAFWHDQQLMLPFCFAHRRWQPRPPRLWMLISAHRDGRFIAEAVRHLGIDSVAGSSTRGGVSALHRLASCLADGQCVAVTPDGPRGPRHRAKLGTVKLAQLSGCAILPVAVFPSRAKRFKSWDRMQLPLPGARISLIVGERIFVPRDIDEKQLEEFNLQLERSLESLEELVKSDG